MAMTVPVAVRPVSAPLSRVSPFYRLVAAFSCFLMVACCLCIGEAGFEAEADSAVTPSGDCDGQGSTLAEPLLASPTEITHTIYDMFQPQWAGHWERRWWAGYQRDILVSNETGRVFELYLPSRPGWTYQSMAFSPYRYNLTGSNLTTLDVHAPEFMPNASYLGRSPVAGAEAAVDIYFQYITPTWYAEYWMPAWEDAGLHPYDYNVNVDDGWYIGTLYAVTMNREAAEEWLGLPQAADPAIWWELSNESYEDLWNEWLDREGNDRLDVYWAYEAPFLTIFTGMKLEEGLNGNIVLTIGNIGWGGYEVLMTRWLTEAGITPHQPYFEDFSLTAEYAEGSTNITFDGVCQYSMQAVRANGTSSTCAWVFEPERIDRIPSSPFNPQSDYNPYADLRYQSWNALDAMFGEAVPYENAPQWMNLSEGEKLVIRMPSGNVPGFDVFDLPDADLDDIFVQWDDYKTGIGPYPDFGVIWDLMNNGTGGLEPGFMVTNYPDNDVPYDYDSVEHTLTFEGPLDFDNFRHSPDGPLYHSAPWIEMNVDHVLEQVMVLPSTKTLLPDTSQEFLALVIDAEGGEIEGATIEWSVTGMSEGEYTLNSTTGASVSFSGSVFGTATLTATATFEDSAFSGSATIIISESLPGDVRTVDYHWYDMFNVPFGEWWDRRCEVYDMEQPITDEYPYLFTWRGETPGDTWIYTNMRTNIVGRDMPGINMNERPEFLPLLGYARGGNADIDWYIQYLTTDELARYPNSNPAWDDGWAVSLNGTVTLDKTAAMAVLNLTQAGWDDFESWWAANGLSVEEDFESWMASEDGGERLDIFNMYDYAMTILYWNMSAEKIGESVVLGYDLVSWGMECLMTRWMHEAFMPTEWFFEDMDFHASIGPESSDLDIDAAVAYSMYAYESVLDSSPCWQWEAMLQDYLPSTIAHPRSDFDPYEGKTYLNRAPGSWWYGMEVEYGYTPAAWNLSEGETLSFEFPTDEVLFAEHIQGETPEENDFALFPAYAIYGYSEPSETDDPAKVVFDSQTLTLTFLGPFDLWTWSNEQDAHEHLEAEWERVGVLPYGIPLVELHPSSIPPEPAAVGLLVEGVDDPVYTGESTSFSVTAVDQYDDVFTGYEGTITFTSTDPLAVLPEDYVFQPSDMGTKEFTVVFHTEGEHTLFAVDVVNDDISGEQADITVVLEITPPVADAGPDISVVLGEVVVLDGQGSYDNVGIVNYTWTFVDGEDVTKYGVSTTHTFSASAIYEVTLNVTDAAGNYDTDTMVVTVEAVNVPPVANAGADATITVGATHDFNGAGSSDSDGSIVNYTWTFTYDGQTRTLYGATPSWKFDVAGEYTVTLTVRDDDGATATDTVTITVEEEEEEEEDEEPGFPLALVAGGIIALLAILLAALLLMKKRKGAGSPPDSGEAGESPPG